LPDLLLRCASISRSSGSQSDDDFDARKLDPQALARPRND
jgi:hypothetical protein